MSKEEKKLRQQNKEKIKQEKAAAKAESRQEKAAAKAESKQEKQTAKAESKQEKQAAKEQSRQEKATSKELERQEKLQQKAEDNKRRHTDIKWDRLDNTAHLFPVIAGEAMSNVYRIAVTLKEEVQPEYLQQALDIVLPKFPGFNLRLRQGIFWYYFEENGKSAPRVQEERHFPCRFIRQNKKHSYLFRVTYYK